MNADPQEISVNVRDLFAFVLRGGILALFFAGVAGSGMYLWTQRQPPVFRAEATLLVARSQAGFSQLGMSAVTAPPIDLGAYRVAAASSPVLTDAARSLGNADVTPTDVMALGATVATSAESGVRDSSLLRVEARRPTPEGAVAVANAVADALVEWDRRRSSESIRRVTATLELQIEALSEQIRALQALGDGEVASQIDGLTRLRAEQQQQLGFARALVASAEGFLGVLQTADSSVVQIAPRPLLSATVAAVLGVILAYGLLLLRAALTTRLRSSDDIGVATGLHVLAEFPNASRPGDPRLREASSYLRTNLLFATEDAHPRVFMITSSSEHEGKTTVARNLAESFVRYGYRTLLVDADLRAPSIMDHYDIVGDAVATEATTEAWLRDVAGLHPVMSVIFSEEEQLDLIPQLQPVANAPELLGRGFRTALARWQDYDVIIIDTPPVLAVSDSLAIAPHCTGTVLVVDQSRSDRRRLVAAVGALRRVGVQLVGVVANRVSQVGVGAGYGSPYGVQEAVAATRPKRPQRVRRETASR